MKTQTNAQSAEKKVKLTTPLRLSALRNHFAGWSKTCLAWSARVGAVVLFTTATNAANLVWIGGSGNWNAAGNWTNELGNPQVPAATDNAFITNNGAYTVTVPQNSPATVGSVTVGGASGAQTLSIDKATLTLNGASVINANGNLDFLVAGSTLTGPGNLTVNGTLNWANGTMTGTGKTTIGSGGTLAIGSGGVTLGRSLDNGGTGTWSGGNLTMSAGVIFNNLAGGIFDIIADGRLAGSATTPINNAGLFRQTAAGASTLINVPFNNSATVNVQVATLSLNLGGTHTGTFRSAAGATLELGGGSHDLAAGSLVTGAGVLGVSGGATTVSATGPFDAGATLNVVAGTVTLAPSCNVTAATVSVSGPGGTVIYNSSGTVGTVNVNAGTLAGTSPVTVTGLLTLAGGTVSNPLVTANGGLAINGGGFILNGGKLINPGTAVWSGGNFTGANGAVFSNLFGATFINTFDGNAPSGAGAAPLWVNEGVFLKTNGTAALGATTIDHDFINTGTVEVRTNTLRYNFNQQTAGLTLLDGGGLSTRAGGGGATAQPIRLLGGSLMGTGLVTVANTVNVINSAALSPGLPLGELEVAGNYQQTAAGVLNIELGGYDAGTNYDRVTVTAGGAGGVATLGGTLNVTLANGFSPTNGATFTFLTAVSRVGAFATFNYPTNDIGMQLNFDPTSASLKVTNLKPAVANPIVDPAAIIYGAAFNLQFPASTFADPDNDPLSYTALGMPPGITFTSSTRTFSGTPTQAGVFLVAVVANDGGTPSLTATNTFTITLNPATLTGSFTASDRVYDGTTNATVLTRTLNGVLAADTANVALTGGNASFGTATASPGKTVTLTGATLTGSAAGNYNLASVGATTAAITPLGITGNFTASDKVYDGTTNATVLTRVLNGVLAADTANVALTGGNASFGTATASPGKTVTLTGATLSGNAAGNYNLGSVGTATAAITPLGITGSFTASDKVYDGTTNATVLTRTLNGVLAADTANVSLTGGSASFSTATASPGKTVTLTGATLSGSAAGNYNLASVGTTTADVTPAGLSVTADNKTKTYGSADPAFTASYAGFVNSETPAVLAGTLAFIRIPGENVGGYLITPGGLTSVNYNVTYNAGTLTITPPAPLLFPLTGAGTPNVIITWTAVSNGNYRVQHKSDLTPSNWTDLGGDVTAIGSTASKTDLRTITNRFYRVQVLP